MMDHERKMEDSSLVENSKTRIFLHLTKTAGGTLKSVLSDTPNLSTYFVYGQQDVLRLKEESPNEYDFVYGHSVYGLHATLGLPESTRYMCFMRHPVTRTISHYYHLRNVEKGPIGDRIRASKDINDFFANNSHWEFSNFMVKVISGVGNARPSPGVNAFRMAVDNLENLFDFVGFQEYFPISVRSLSKLIGHELVVKKDINIGRYSLGDISSTTLSRIEELNIQDIKLYKFAIRKFL
ncbi:sulfotransferase family 2 domain-containing protein [Roseicyclus marinus]|uniref:sulfotransferase family 2 domain-containing protein n=1 Tax=Roseicyclus marinus TaxID=2161673 RepID=UPI00240F62F2|nr:sulfotransferase family 2 domain-containing protein [Roseicyclus marinus]MDG3041559.1 sulfotransferase family 2 domain-containing protein [Roseicyclus marinus]